MNGTGNDVIISWDSEFPAGTTFRLGYRYLTGSGPINQNVTVDDSPYTWTVPSTTVDGLALHGNELTLEIYAKDSNGNFIPGSLKSYTITFDPS